MQPQVNADFDEETLSAASIQPDIDGNLYFLDEKQALAVARQRNQISTFHPTITTLQTCFYNGPVPDDAPENMISLPLEELEERLLDMPHPFPEQIIFPDNTEKSTAEEITQKLKQALRNVTQKRAVLTYKTNLKIRKQKPEFERNAPLRIFMLSNRLTTVMQYCSRQLAKALKDMGHEVLLCMEENDMQVLDKYLRTKSLYEFRPHVLFNINYMMTRDLHPDVFYFSWWQDPIPIITRGTSLPWRERDITLSLSRQLDEYLQKTGCKNIHRQSFCIDTDVFHVDKDIPRENKVVFIGSSYRRRLQNNPAESGALQDIIQHMEVGNPIDEHLLRSISKRWGVQYHKVYWDLFHYAVRDVTVQWLCRDSTIPVEIYGRGWEDDPIVGPHFKGELPHGSAVAEVYNSARLSLVSHPSEVNSQRLVEAAACGSVPVVFDCRHIAEPPFWEQHCLFFSTAQQLQECLNSENVPDPTALAKSYTYDRLAQFVTNTVHEKLGRKD